MIAGVTLMAFVDALADALAERLARRDASLVDQRNPRGLRGRRHIEAVRRRIAAGEGDAWIVGRDYLLTPAAVRQELERGYASPPGNDNGRPGARPARKAKPTRASELQRLKRELEADMRRARGKGGS